MRSRNLGYTVVELLIVLSLVALLVGLALPRYTAAVESSKERGRAQNLNTLRDALDKFRADQGRYPAVLAELVQRQYLRQIPVDPVSGSSSWRLVDPAQPGGLMDVLPPEEAGAPPSVAGESP